MTTHPSNSPEPLFALPFSWRDPADLFAGIAERPGAVLLDGAQDEFSYLAADPFQVLTPETCPGDPFARLAAEMARFRLEPVAGLPPFQTGAIGYLGYELGNWLERLPVPKAAGPALPEFSIGFYDVIAAFDHRRGLAWILSSGFPETGPLRRERAEARGRAFGEFLASLPERPATSLIPVRWEPEIGRHQYEAKVMRAVDYIHAGDIFQANLSQRFLARWPEGADVAAVHRALRARSPAPFAAALALGPGRFIASASPERFLRLEPGGKVVARPIKGTRPRGATPALDAALAEALLASEKDRAENLMIVDLLRNDISRVAALGSVRVPELCALESFANVHHLVSTVEGQLRPGLGAVDLLRAAFPGGSVTGAPKIRAMEIIHELEDARRGPYCGAIAWLGFDGGMDSSIVIRTLMAAEGEILAQAGGGIVADSRPGDEYDETLVKARPLLETLGECPC